MLEPIIMIGSMSERRPRRVTVLPSARVVQTLLQQVQNYAEQSENVFFSSHARERMQERDVTDVEVLRVLRLGMIDGRPWIEERGGDMACKVVQKQPCGRRLGVVTIIITAKGRLFVKTVEWEDVR